MGDSPNDQEFFQCMQATLNSGVDPNVSRRDETALHYAAARPNPTEARRVRFATMLIDRGARLDVRDALLRSTPLGSACRWGRQDLVELLIARAAPVREPDAQPWATPLAWAEKIVHPEIARLLARPARHPTTTT